jgi:thioester reductase-like protein
MRRLFVTGATGTVGAQLVPQLMRDGWQVSCLVRGIENETPESRLAALFGSLAERIEPIAGDLLKPRFGLDPAWLKHRKGSFEAAVHCAASISFDDRQSDSIWATNLGGTRHFAQVVRDLSIPRVHAVSTAYVAGDAPRFSETDLEIGQRSRNAYEASKKAAEELLIASLGDCLQIIRPSIVVGHSDSGQIHAFEGFYNAPRALHRIVDGLATKSILPEGIRRQDGRIVMPLTLRVDAAARLNLVPINWVVDVMASLIDVGQTGNCCHLTHDSPIGIDEVVATVSQHFAVAGLRAEDVPQARRSREVDLLQRRLDAALRAYRPYLMSDTVFTGNTAARLLGARYMPPPRIDSAMVQKLLEFATSVNWRRPGNRKPPETNLAACA